MDDIGRAPARSRTPATTTTVPGEGAGGNGNGTAPRSAIVRVSADQPCLVCRKPNWCSRAGELHLCTRVHDVNVAGFRWVGLSNDGVCGLYVRALGNEAHADAPTIATKTRQARATTGGPIDE